MTYTEDVVRLEIESAMSDYLMENNTIVELLASPSGRISLYKKQKIQHWLNLGLARLEQQIKRTTGSKNWKIIIPGRVVSLPVTAINGNPLMLTYCVVFYDSLHIVDIDVYGDGVQLVVYGDYSLLVLGYADEYVIPLNSYRETANGLFVTQSVVTQNGEIIIRNPTI